MKARKKIHNPIYVWDYYEEPPIVDLLNQARKCPGLKAWSYDNGGTYFMMTFAQTADEARRRFKRIYGDGEASELTK